MKLLIITQKVDINDDVLGFFHSWIEEFARNCEFVTVICLQKGEYDLPDNANVLSLGKENGVQKLKYIFNFYKHIWFERKNYDSVFVHMNQEYVLLGGLFWKLLRKKILLWRNHPSGNFLTCIAMSLSNKIFCTSKYSFTARSKKTVLMPVGIDMDRFKKTETQKIKNSILFLARISPVKKQDLLIEALNILNKESTKFSADFYGNSLPKDMAYAKFLKEKVKEHKLENLVHFYSGIPNAKTPDIYNQYEIFVNASPNGMYDKTIFEAMACGCLILVSNDNLRGKISDNFIFKQGDILELSKKLEKLLNYNDEERQNASRQLKNLAKNNSLKILSEKLFFNM